MCMPMHMSTPMAMAMFMIMPTCMLMLMLMLMLMPMPMPMPMCLHPYLHLDEADVQMSQPSDGVPPRSRGAAYQPVPTRLAS